MKNLKKYKQNLRIENNNVISYTTNVATIEGNMLIQLGWWSVTTQKHINYVAKELNQCKIILNNSQREIKKQKRLKGISIIFGVSCLVFALVK